MVRVFSLTDKRSRVSIIHRLDRAGKRQKRGMCGECGRSTRVLWDVSKASTEGGCVTGSMQLVSSAFLTYRSTSSRGAGRRIFWAQIRF